MFEMLRDAFVFLRPWRDDRYCGDHYILG
jgi:hypothetical protein